MNKLFFLFLMTSSLTQADLLTTIAPEYQASVAYQQQNFAAAQSGYVRSLEQSPDDAIANYNVGTALYKQKKFEQAQAHFERAVKNFSGNSVLLEQSLFNQGNSFVQMGEYEHAIELYEKALEIDQDNERTQKNLTLARELLEEQKRKEEEQKKEDKQKNDQKKDDKQDQDKQKDKKGKDDKDDSSKQDKSDDSDQKDSDQQGKKNKDQDGQQQNSEQNKSEQSDSGNEKKDQSADQNKNQREQGKQDDVKKNGDKQQGVDSSQQGEEQKQDQSLQKAKEQDQKLSRKNDDKKEEQESDSGVQEQDVAEQKEIALQDQYAAQMNADSASDDRLNKKEAMLMKALSDHENSIQKKLLQMNVAKEGGKHEKNW